MKKNIKALLGLWLCVSLCACGNKAEMSSSETEEVVAEVQEESDTIIKDVVEDDLWKQAYIDYLNSFANIDELASNYTYFLIYVDDNDVPELFIRTNCEASGESIVTYFDGEINDIHLSRIGSAYVDKSGLVMTNTGHMDYYPVTITKLENGMISDVANGMSYWADEDRERYANGETEDYILSYEWEEQAVTEEEFYTHINEIYDMEKSHTPERGYVLEEFISILKTGKWLSADHTYELILQDATWNEAQDICHSKGGYLATITCPDEADAIAEIIGSEEKKDIAYYVGYRSCEWVGDDFFSNRWINADGSYTETMLVERSEYNSPGYDMMHREWRLEDHNTNCGIVKYYDNPSTIYIFEGPDELLKVSPNYAGKMGFICEYDY